DVTGTVAIPNKIGIGFSWQGTNVLVGGSGAGEANIIANSERMGISISQVNCFNNTFSRNRIYGSGEEEIILYNGANNGMTAPVITSVIPNGANYDVAGTLTCTAFPCTVELFRVDDLPSAVGANVTGAGGGFEYLDSATVAAGTAFSFINVAVSPNSTKVTATITDNDGNTSEFADNFDLPGGACNTYVNDTTGSNTYDGTAPTFMGGVTGPKKTIQAGISAAGVGCTCYVAAGTYVENITMKDDVDLEGEAVSTTIIDGNDNGTVVKAANAAIRNFTLQNGSGTLDGLSKRGGGIVVDSVSPTISNMLILDNDMDHFHNTYGAGISINIAPSPPLIENVTIVNNTITTPFNAYGAGIYTNSDFVLKNSIVVNNTGDGVFAKIGGIYCTGCTGTYSNVFNNLTVNTSGYTAGGGSTTVDPVFVGGGDYHLDGCSPLIDAGDPADDFSNEPASNGGRINMGAFGNTSEATQSGLCGGSTNGTPCDTEWPRFHCNNHTSGESSSAVTAPLSKKWEFTTGDIIASSPAVANGKVFFGSWDKKIYALDETTGAKIWEFTTGGFVTSSPAVANGKVFVGSYDNKVYALDENTGAKLWEYTTGDRVYASPAVAGGKVFIGSLDNKVYALDENTGAKLWEYITAGDVYVSPSVADGKVFIGSDDNKVYALDENTGAKLWEFSTFGPISSTPAVADGKVFVGSLDFKVYALDENTGIKLWEYTTTGPIYASAAISNGKVIIGSDDDKVYALDENTGAKLWDYTTGLFVSSSPAVANGMVFVGSYDNKVYALDENIGTKLWEYTTADWVYSSPAVAGGKVFIGSNDFKLYAFESGSSCPGGIVTTNADSGNGSLRECITQANSTAGADTITFDNALIGQTITLASSLPDVTDDATTISNTTGG
ncbi:PQQ-binding-like beta-propeller repeat protein, partial [bacterium]